MDILERVKDALGMGDRRDETDMPFGGDDAHLSDERVERPAGVGMGRPTKAASPAETGYPAPATTERGGRGERS